MIEHKVWVGADYEKALLHGKRVAIMGYSHWDNAADHVEKTRDTINDVIANDGGAAYFSTIRNYFGHECHSEFWPKIIFFNYVPSYVGDGSRRYANATKLQYEAAEKRFLQVLDEHKPDLLLALTKKVWEKLPDGFEEGSDAIHGAACGVYERNGHATRVVLLRHPQGADGAKMGDVIGSMLQMSL